ncbi:MAG: hypothetical protein K9K64_13225 [Desulfohalobiaceae bacterium]|nr:hypothetical protein [Desulfohalobiaceae bacterium]
MTMKNILHILLAGLVITLLLGTGRYLTEEDSTMVFAGSQSAAQKKPLMDEKVPVATETATFAMG